MNWKRATKHALVTLAITIAGGLVLLFATHPVDPEKLGEGVGRFAVVSLLAGYGIGYVAERRPRTARWAQVGFAVAIAVIVGALIVAVNDRPRHHQVAATRVALLDDGKRLRHPDLGFSLLRPPASFHDAPEVAAAMAKSDPEATVYAYAETPPQSALLVTIESGADDVAAVMRGVRSGLLASLERQAPDAKVQWVRDEVAGGVGYQHAVIGPMHMRIEAHPVRDALVVLTSFSRDEKQFTDILASFTP